MDVVKITGGKAEINIFPKQSDFLSSECDEVLYGGAAGGGKSYAMLLFALKRRMEHPGTTGIIFRRTYPELEKSVIQESHKIYTYFGAKYNQAKHCWTFPKVDGYASPSVQWFGHAEGQGDVYKYLSSEFQDMCFDESTLFTEFQFTYLTSRCRSSRPEVKPLIRLASNPGNVGHLWHYKRYIEPYYVHKIWKNKETGKTLTFIPAKVKDNPALCEADPGYVQRLKELPEKKYLALAEGRWDVFEGMYFNEWNATPGQSVLRVPRKPDTFTQKYLSFDWGFSNPACVLWHEVTPLGRIFTYRELYITRQGPKKLAKIILEMTPENEVIECMYASPEIWGKKADLEGGGEPIRDLMQEVLGTRIQMVKANNSRVQGWLKMREYMGKAPDGLPWWQVSPLCVNLIRTVPTLIHDDHRPEDVDGKCDDDPAEASRYFLVSLKDVPRADINPYESNYEKIFGVRKHKTKYSSYPQMPIGRGGY